MSPVHVLQMSPVHVLQIVLFWVQSMFLQMSPVHVLQMSPVHVLQMSPVHVLQTSPVHVLQIVLFWVQSMFYKLVQSRFYKSSPGFTTCLVFGGQSLQGEDGNTASQYTIPFCNTSTVVYLREQITMRGRNSE
jgi:hypothetical protein